jgi:hypothetical protein
MHQFFVCYLDYDAHRRGEGYHVFIGGGYPNFRPKSVSVRLCPVFSLQSPYFKKRHLKNNPATPDCFPS